MNGIIFAFSLDRKSTRLNSSHGYISYAVFCLKKLRQELDGLSHINDDLSSLGDRLDTTGYLRPETAKGFGALGYVGRASFETFGAPKDSPLSPYPPFSID